MSAEPILIPCEGSGQETHDSGVLGAPVRMCAMCGEWVGFGVGFLAVPHDRKDILAMLTRGDFDV